MMAIVIAKDKVSEWALKILRANGWTGEEAHVRRVIIDVSHGGVPTLYVEHYADSATFDIRPVPLEAEVVTLTSKADHEPT